MLQQEIGNMQVVMLNSLHVPSIFSGTIATLTYPERRRRSPDDGAEEGCSFSVPPEGLRSALDRERSRLTAVTCRSEVGGVSEWNEQHLLALRAFPNFSATVATNRFEHNRERALLSVFSKRFKYQVSAKSVCGCYLIESKIGFLCRIWCTSACCWRNWDLNS